MLIIIALWDDIENVRDKKCNMHTNVYTYNIYYATSSLFFKLAKGIEKEEEGGSESRCIISICCL